MCMIINSKKLINITIKIIIKKLIYCNNYEKNNLKKLIF